MVYEDGGFGGEDGLVEVLYTTSAIRTRMQFVGFDSRFHRNVRYVPGIGVVISAGVYRRLTGKIFVLGGAVSRLGLKGKIPRPFVVVHSGKTTTGRSGLSLSILERSTSSAEGEGCKVGGRKARSMAWKSDIGSTRRVVGYEAVKTGSKMAAK